MLAITRGCREKTLLRFLELKLLKVRNLGFTLYKQFYTSLNVVSSDANVSSLERRPGLVDNVFKQLYGYNNPEQTPEGFNTSKHSDLQRLSSYLNVTIVIYSNDTSRLWFSSNKKTNSDSTIIQFLFKKEKVYYLDQECNSNSVIQHLCQRTEAVTTSFQEAFERLMQFPPLSEYEGLSEHEFTNRTRDLTEQYKIHQCVIFFFYSGCPRKHFRHYTSHVFLQSFIHLGIEPTNAQEVADSTPLIIYHDTMGIPSPAVIKRLKQQMLNNLLPVSDSNIISPHGCNRIERIKQNKELVSERRRATAIKRKKKWKAKNTKMKKMCNTLLDLSPQQSEEEEEEDDTTKSRTFEKICKCHICTKELLPNMSSCGQERLCTIKPSTYDLLTMLGIATQTNKHIIQDLCEMSLASVDIESMTQTTDNQDPVPNTFQGSSDHSYVGAPINHVQKVQKPLMIAHTDWLGDTQVLSLADYLDEGAVIETNANIYKMMESYWTDVVLKRHQQIVEKKRVLVKPILDYLKAYNQEHVSFCQEFCSKTQNNVLEDMIPNYRNTLPGMLEERLEKLIHQYVIFSFYGSGYDMILLETYLIPLLFEQELRPKIDKKGNKVSIIRTKNGIQFRDITKLLAPSTNLRSFGQMFNLDIQKGHFPFKILSHVQSLSIPFLPVDLHMWTSDLSGNKTAIKRKDVEEAVTFFNNSGFTCVGDYLRHYLILDVQILHRATNLWRRRLFEVIGLDFVDIQKFTISSLSSYAGSHTLALQLKTGWFFPNNNQNYALMKRGMRG